MSHKVKPKQEKFEVESIKKPPVFAATNIKPAYSAMTKAWEHMTYQEQMEYCDRMGGVY